MNSLKSIFTWCVCFAAATQLNAASPPVLDGLQIGLAASDINTADTTQVVQQSGVYYVKSWQDAYTGQQATQSTVSRCPIYLPNALGGRPVLKFDGVDDFLTTTVPQIAGDKTIFIVEMRAGTQLATEISSTSGTSGMFLANSYGGAYETEGRLYVAHDLLVPAKLNNFILKSFTLKGTTGTLRVNGASTSGQISDAASGNYTISDANSFFFPGQIAEILIYNYAMGDALRALVESYLNDRYSLKDVSPPVTNGLQLRLAANTINAADATQVTQTGGLTYVTDWLDSSGNGRHATQATSAWQPVYVPNALRGQPVLQFDGKHATLATTLPQIAGDKSIFVVHKRVGSQLRAEISSTSKTSGMFLANNSGTSTETEGRLYVAHDLQCAALLNTFVLKSYIRSGSTGTLMVNDISSSSQVADAASGYYTISDGFNYFFAGQIAEILIYNRTVTESERQAIENYLSEKYGLWDQNLPNRSGLQLWLSADGVSTDPSYDAPQVRVSNGATYISNWIDRGWFGRNATQATTDFQPEYRPNSLWGRGALYFDGTNDFLSTVLPQISGNKSIFVVQCRTGTGFGTEISGTGATGHYLGDGASTESKGRISLGSDLQTPWVYGNFLVKSFIRNGSTETLRVNAAAVTGTAPDAVAGNYTISDSRSPFQGFVNEVLVYSRALSNTERFAVEDYLSDKWSYPTTDMSSVAQDLQVPAVTAASPAPGLRVKQTSPEYAGTNVFHALYLPTDWKAGVKYPVIVEYGPNGGYKDLWNGYTTTGNIDEDALGYGISGGKGFIWISMPTIGGSPLANQTTWWGDVSQTKDYCLKTIRHVCEDYGGDPSAILLTGFSRGAAACNFIGLNDDTMADVWLAFLPHSGYDYDGQYGATYPGLESAHSRLQRVKGRLQHLTLGDSLQGSWESSLKYYLSGMGADLDKIAFRTLPYANHTGFWALRPIQLRRDIRAWAQNVVASRPGTHSLRGRVLTSSGTPIPGARVQSGYTHFTFADANGAYALDGLINSIRTVTASAGNYVFLPQTVTVYLTDTNNVDLRANP